MGHVTNIWILCCHTAIARHKSVTLRCDCLGAWVAGAWARVARARERSCSIGNMLEL